MDNPLTPEVDIDFQTAERHRSVELTRRIAKTALGTAVTSVKVVGYTGAFVFDVVRHPEILRTANGSDFYSLRIPEHGPTNQN